MRITRYTTELTDDKITAVVKEIAAITRLVT